MKFIYQEHSLKPGIYKILNTHTNRIYIGQAKEFKSRWKDHKRSLIAKKHQNRFLQADFNKCLIELGHDDFLEFHVLEVMEGSTKEERNKKEEEHISGVWNIKLGDETRGCYNFKEKIESIERSCYSNTPEETRRKISEAVKHSRAKPENKEKQSRRMKEQWNLSGRREALSERMKQQWSEGDRKAIYGKKIKDMWAEGTESREKLLASRQIPELVSLFVQKCHSPEARAKIAAKQTKNHGKVVSPDGQIFEVIGLKAFCEDHGIPHTQIANLGKLLKGQVKSVSGWKRLEPELIFTGNEQQVQSSS
jgi:group I intron endonuclease